MQQSASAARSKSSSTSKTSAAASLLDKPRRFFVPSIGQPRSVGVGLGLSISRKALLLHGGDIQMRNLPGKACIFTITLPRKLDLAPRADRNPS
jgi:signal transduction histidine kinase